MLDALMKTVLIVVGILAVIGGGACVALNVAVMPNAVVIVMALSVAVAGGALLRWVIKRQRAEEQKGNASPPHDHPDDDR